MTEVKIVNGPNDTGTSTSSIKGHVTNQHLKIDSWVSNFVLFCNLGDQSDEVETCLLKNAAAAFKHCLNTDKKCI